MHNLLLGGLHRSPRTTRLLMHEGQHFGQLQPELETGHSGRRAVSVETDQQIVEVIDPSTYPAVFLAAR